MGCRTQPIDQPHFQTVEIDGLVVAVHPMNEQAEIERTFGLNLLDREVIPIKFLIENHNALSSFTVSKDEMFIVDRASGITNSSPTGKAASLATASRAGSVVPGVIGGAIGGGPIGAGFFLVFGGILVATAKDAALIDRNYEHNLRGKEFFTKTLDPGQKAEGFIYFQFQRTYSSVRSSEARRLNQAKAIETTQLSGNYHVVGQIKNSFTQEVKSFDFKVYLNLDKP